MRPNPTFPSTDRRLARSAATTALSSASTGTASARHARPWWSAAANRAAATVWRLPYADRLAIKWVLMALLVALMLVAEQALLALALGWWWP